MKRHDKYINNFIFFIEQKGNIEKKSNKSKYVKKESKVSGRNKMRFRR